MSLHASKARGQVRAFQVNERWHGILVGLMPLGLLIGISIVTLLTMALARQLVTEFTVQQQTTLIILGVGFVMALVAYTIAVFLILRRTGTWEKNGLEAREHATLWTLGVSTLIVLLPLLLVIVLPQHPAS